MVVPAVCGASSTAAKKRVRLSLASCRTEPAAVAAVAARHGRSLSKARLKRVSSRDLSGVCEPGVRALCGVREAQRLCEGGELRLEEDAGAREREVVLGRRDRVHRRVTALAACARRRDQAGGVAVDVASERRASSHWQVDMRCELAVDVLKLPDALGCSAGAGGLLLLV